MAASGKKKNDYTEFQQQSMSSDNGLVARDRCLGRVCQSILFRHWIPSVDLVAILWISHLWVVTLHSRETGISCFFIEFNSKKAGSSLLFNHVRQTPRCASELRSVQGALEPRRTLSLSIWTDETTKKKSITNKIRRTRIYIDSDCSIHLGEPSHESGTLSVRIMTWPLIETLGKFK